jgi:hypothetical protein
MTTSTTDQMNDAEFLAYLKRIDRASAFLIGGSGLIAGSIVALLLGFSSQPCLVFAGVGAAITAASAYVLKTAPTFVTTVPLPEPITDPDFDHVADRLEYEATSRSLGYEEEARDPHSGR